MKKFLKKFIDVLMFFFTGKGTLANEMIEQGLLSYEGQGRDKYGN
jgi:hypothetical protein